MKTNEGRHPLFQVHLLLANSLQAQISLQTISSLVFLSYKFLRANGSDYLYFFLLTIPFICSVLRIAVLPSRHCQFIRFPNRHEEWNVAARRFWSTSAGSGFWWNGSCHKNFVQPRLFPTGGDVSKVFKNVQITHDNQEEAIKGRTGERVCWFLNPLSVAKVPDVHPIYW